MEFEIKCHLGYAVSGAASFLFNVAVTKNPFQRIIAEHFDVTGAESCQETVIDGQRYHRLTSKTARVELSYEATVDVTHELFGDPSRLRATLRTYSRRSAGFRLSEPLLSVRSAGPTGET